MKPYIGALVGQATYRPRLCVKMYDNSSTFARRIGVSDIPAKCLTNRAGSLLSRFSPGLRNSARDYSNNARRSY